jgi:hypothetical protein
MQLMSIVRSRMTGPTMMEDLETGKLMEQTMVDDNTYISVNDAVGTIAFVGVSMVVLWALPPLIEQISKTLKTIKF